MKLKQTDDINYLKDSVITTHSITMLEDLKAKLKVKFFSKLHVFCTLVSRNQLSNLFFKEIAFPV